MFAHRYFAARYFTPRYWPPGAGVIVVEVGAQMCVAAISVYIACSGSPTGVYIAAIEAPVHVASVLGSESESWSPCLDVPIAAHVEALQDETEAGCDPC